MEWNKEAEEKFDRLIIMVPSLYRRQAECHAVLKAEEIASGRGAHAVEECDIVNAFIRETPPSFQEWMREKAKKAGFNLDMAERPYA